MSMRLHYDVKHEIVPSNNEQFSYKQVEIASILNDYECQIFRSEDNDYAEEFFVPAEQIEQMVEDLKKCTERELYGIPVDDLIVFFEDALAGYDKSNSDIYFSWF